MASSVTEAPSQRVKAMRPQVQASYFRGQNRRHRKIKGGIRSSKVKRRAGHCKSSEVIHKFENRKERTNPGTKNITVSERCR